jgi:hypothetical protein
MNTYIEENVCLKCKQKGEVIFHQYINSFSCQTCGFWWDFGVDIVKLEKLLSKFNIKKENK